MMGSTVMRSGSLRRPILRGNVGAEHAAKLICRFTALVTIRATRLARAAFGGVRSVKRRQPARSAACASAFGASSMRRDYFACSLGHTNILQADSGFALLLQPPVQFLDLRQFGSATLTSDRWRFVQSIK
jgi:hypothetical protein